MSQILINAQLLFKNLEYTLQLIEAFREAESEFLVDETVIDHYALEGLRINCLNIKQKLEAWISSR